MVHDMDGFALYARNQRADCAVGWETLDVVQAVETVVVTWSIEAWTALVRLPDQSVLRAFWVWPENAASKGLRHCTATSNVALSI
jgi:hypothetical protein